jgi:hypothetical protein
MISQFLSVFFGRTMPIIQDVFIQARSSLVAKGTQPENRWLAVSIRRLNRLGDAKRQAHPSLQ